MDVARQLPSAVKFWLPSTIIAGLIAAFSTVSSNAARLRTKGSSGARSKRTPYVAFTDTAYGGKAIVKRYAP